MKKCLANRSRDSKISIGTHEIQAEEHAGADKRDRLVQEKVLFVRESSFLPVEVVRTLTQDLQKLWIEDNIIVWNK